MAVILRSGTFAKRLFEVLKRDKSFVWGMNDEALEALCDRVADEAAEFYDKRIIRELSDTVRSLELQLAQARRGKS